MSFWRNQTHLKKLIQLFYGFVIIFIMNYFSKQISYAKQVNHFFYFNKIKFYFF